MQPTNRRRFLCQTGIATCLGGTLLSAGGVTSPIFAAPSGKRPKVAAIFTVLRFRSHAYNILENFLGPYYFNGKLTDPGVDVVSFFADQFPADDMARKVARRFDIPLYPTIDEALCVGGKKLNVDAVLLIGEHGDYPYNARGQHLYPRKRFFDEAVAVMRRANRFVPVFNDKHLSYRWDWAKEMYDTARAHQMPLLAGSSVPLAQRKPPLDLPAGAEIEEAVSIHGGGLESYDFHALEVLQSVVESRKGGETGIARIELLYGEKLKKAGAAGRWSQQLVDAAMNAEQAMKARRQPRPKTGVFKAQPKQNPPPRPDGPHAIAIEYKDGLRATVLKIGSSSDRWNFACRLRGETKPRATAYFNSPWGNRGLFKALSHAIQQQFIHGIEPYPAERTLLTTGMVEAVMRSFEQQGQPIETPQLEINYQARPWKQFRELGRTWNIITTETPQPTTFQPRSFADLHR
ncbi:MAG: hypothetical protein QGH33_16375 [Pirellulaceae bacterium]|jgi:hypothetical protein|nr:hypothetical protein [Pirellulaceae bacterium]HJN09422.1 hypothetical protein [Pirellulaceae bacterium]